MLPSHAAELAAQSLAVRQMMLLLRCLAASRCGNAILHVGAAVLAAVRASANKQLVVPKLWCILWPAGQCMCVQVLLHWGQQRGVSWPA